MKGNKTILGSIFIIGLVSIILAGSTTGAFFKDVETSKNNSFSVRSLDLKITDNDEGWGNGITGTWTATNMKPGDKWVFNTPFIKFFNDGSIKDNHFEITCNYSVKDTCNTSDPDYLESDTNCTTNLYPDEMAKEMVITKSIYRGIENSRSFCINTLNGKKYTSFHSTGRYCFGRILGNSSDWKIEDKDGDGKITFYDLKMDKLDNLPTPNEETIYTMDIKFDEDAGNDFQGDTFNLTMIFTLNQDLNQ